MNHKNIFDYTESNLDKFLSTMDIDNIHTYNLKEKRCLTFYYLYVEYHINQKEIDRYGGFDKILEAFKCCDTFEIFKN